MESERSVCAGEEGDELKQEEEKMEEFFSLIRSFREARNRRRSELKEMERERDGEKERKKRRSDDAESSWVPCFEWEDFREDMERRKPPLIFRSPPAGEKQDEKIEDGVNGGLDLSLTL